MHKVAKFRQIDGKTRTQCGNFTKFPPRFFGKFWIFFREIEVLKGFTIKMILQNPKFHLFRPKMRSPGLNTISSIQIRESESVERLAMFCEV